LGRLGERQTQLQATRTSLEMIKGLNTQAATDKQGADVAQVAVEYNSMMALLQMVMKVAAEAVTPSLIDYI
jgi:flagellin-like hook-associated protein FlgL